MKKKNSVQSFSFNFIIYIYTTHFIGVFQLPFGPASKQGYVKSFLFNEEESYWYIIHSLTRMGRGAVSLLLIVKSFLVLCWILSDSSTPFKILNSPMNVSCYYHESCHSWAFVVDHIHQGCESCYGSVRFLFFSWHINLCRLYNAKAILLEHVWYYLTHSWEDKGVHTFPKGICLKVTIIVWLEYELPYYDSAVHRFNHYTTRAPPKAVTRYIRCRKTDYYITIGTERHGWFLN